MITCSQAVQQLWDYLENDVAADDRARIDEHLAFCRRCCGEAEFAEELRGMLSSAAEVELPPEVEARLVSVIDDVTEGPGASPSTDGSPADRQGGVT